MAIVPSGQKFHTVPSTVVTTNLGSALANSQREIFTMDDITSTVRPYKVLTIGNITYADTSIYNSVTLESTLGEYEFAFIAPNSLVVRLLDYTSIGIDLSKLYVVSQQVFGSRAIFQPNLEESNILIGQINFFCRFIEDIDTLAPLDMGNIEIRIYE
jgi:hypothetical protein